jgi:hypothetical protein
MTIRDRIRKWLEIQDVVDVTDALHRRCDGLDADVVKLQGERAELIAKLKARNVVPMMPMYKDYESAQVDALQEFKEK